MTLRGRSSVQVAWSVTALLVWAVACGPGGEIDIPEPELSSAEPGVVRAVRDAQQAVRDAPGSAEAWGRLGDCFRAQRWLDEAVVAYRQAEQLEPDAFLWPYLIGDILSYSDPRAAAERFAAALEADPGYAPAHVRYAAILSKIGRNEEALGHLQTAVRLDPRLAHGHLGLGRVQLSQGRFEEARGHLETALALRPDLGEAHQALAQVLQVLGEKESAEEHADRADALPPMTPLPDPRHSRPPEPAVSPAHPIRRAPPARKMLAAGPVEA